MNSGFYTMYGVPVSRERSGPGELIIYTGEDHRIAEVVLADPMIHVADGMLYELAFAYTPGHTKAMGIYLVGQRMPDLDAGDWCEFAMAGKHDGHECVGQQARRPFIPERPPGHWCACFTGCRLVIEPTSGARVVYVIREYDERVGAWQAVWPD